MILITTTCSVVQFKPSVQLRLRDEKLQFVTEKNDSREVRAEPGSFRSKLFSCQLVILSDVGPPEWVTRGQRFRYC